MPRNPRVQTHAFKSWPLASGESLRTGPPDWPRLLSDSPRVLAPVRAYLDGAPVEVTLASLAPGYVGFYLIEIQLPRIVNAGPTELFLEAEGQQTNRVRLYLEP